MRKLAKKSHKAVLKKYGKEHYRTMANKRWEAYKGIGKKSTSDGAGKTENKEEIGVSLI